MSCGKGSTDTTSSATGASSDTRPPSAPANLTATAASSAQVNLTWIAATDDVGVTGYRVERCQGTSCSLFAQIAAPPSTSFNDTALAASTSYSYRVRATDAAGNLGNYSNTTTASTPAASAIGVSITPGRGGLTLSQTLTFSASVTNDVASAGVTWTTSGGNLSSASTTSATFSSSAPGSFTITATSVADPTRSTSATVGVTGLAGVFTQRYDAQRTGQNRQEYALTPGSVSNSTFGKLFACAVDAELYAQPLYVANLPIAGGTHNTVFVATQNDSVYAFDADTSPCVQRWKVSLLNGGTPVSPGDTGETGDINTKIGITGTPVIDPATNTLYVVSKTIEGSDYHQRLHALSLVDGTEKFNGPAEIGGTLTVAGSGDTGDAGVGCSASSGNVPFCALRENQRPGLLLLNGIVYIAWASHGDNTPYHGWVIGYNASNLAQTPVLFNTTPNGGMGGIWQSGTGPAADADGNIYVITGNGDFDPGTGNYGDSFIKLSTASGLSVADFFTPAVQGDLNANDWDLGSGGPVVLPDSAGSPTHPHLLIGGDKEGILYLVDRDNMTGFNGVDQIVQKVQVVPTPPSNCITCGIFSTPAFWEGKLYITAIGDVLKQYSLANANLSFSRQASDTFAFPGASPAVSSTGATNGIVWAVNTSKNGTPNPGTGSGPAVLFAYDAATLTKLYSSPSSGVGAAGNAVKFVLPTVANGKVYLGTQTELSVFGLLPGASALFTDDFNRADVNPIAGNWLTSGAAGGAIVSNQLTGGNTGDNFIFVSSVRPPANQYAKITFVSTANSGADMDNGGPIVRGNANGDGWLFDWVSNKTIGNSTWTLFRVIKDVGTPIASGAFGRALVNGDVVEIRAVGSLISGYLNGVAVPGATTTDTTYPTGGFGVHLFSNTGRWDNFEGGSL